MVLHHLLPQLNYTFLGNVAEPYLFRKNKYTENNYSEIKPCSQMSIIKITKSNQVLYYNSLD